MNITALQKTLIGLIILCLMALGGWYVYITGEQKNLDTTVSGRGASDLPPSSSLGSSYTNIQTSSQPQVIPLQRDVVARLWHVTTTPVSGMNFITNTNATTLRFVERGTGHIFDANAQTRSLERVTNTLMPKIYEARVASGGNVLLRSIDEKEQITTFVGSPVRSTSTGQLTGIYFDADIEDAVWNPEGTKIAYIAGKSPQTALYTSLPDGTKKTKIAELGIGGWRLSWGDSLFFFKKPILFVSTPVFSDVHGLRSVVAHNEHLVVSSSVSGLLEGSVSGTPQTYAKIATRETQKLPDGAWVEKCVFVPTKTPQGQFASTRILCAIPKNVSTRFPESWYLGTERTVDTLSLIDTRDGSVSIVETPETTPLDIELLVTDATGEFVAFRNAYDQTLWMLQLTK